MDYRHLQNFLKQFLGFLGVQFLNLKEKNDCAWATHFFSIRLVIIEVQRLICVYITPTMRKNLLNQKTGIYIFLLLMIITQNISMPERSAKN